jgi:hypothetical protein
MGTRVRSEGRIMGSRGRVAPPSPAPATVSDEFLAPEPGGRVLLLPRARRECRIVLVFRGRRRVSVRRVRGVEPVRCPGRDHVRRARHARRASQRALLRPSRCVTSAALLPFPAHHAASPSRAPAEPAPVRVRLARRLLPRLYHEPGAPRQPPRRLPARPRRPGLRRPRRRAPGVRGLAPRALPARLRRLRTRRAGRARAQGRARARDRHGRLPPRQPLAWARAHARA